MYFVYILRSKANGKFYCGMTDNIDRRLSEHNSHHKSTKTTKVLCDYEIVFCQIENDRSEARKMELFFKSGFGREVRDELLSEIKIH